MRDPSDYCPAKRPEQKNETPKEDKNMNKKMIWVLLAAVLVLAVAAAVLFAANRDVAEVKTSEIVTVTEESTPEPETAEESEAEADAEAAALSEEEEMEIELVTLTGVITEVTDEYVMLDAGELGQIQANLFEDTLLEGVEELAVGQVAIVTYDGKMTRSLPAQITALRIGVYEVKGTVTAIEEGRITIEQTEGVGEVVLTLPESAPELAVGDAITAYTTGISTMSLPPQMNAIAIMK